MSWLGQCAKGVPRKWRAAQAESGREGRRAHPAIARQNYLTRRSGRAHV